MKENFTGRKIIFCREISKLYEEYIRKDIDKLEPFINELKGELTVVISEKNTKDKFLNKDKVIAKAKKYLKKYSLKDVVELLFESEKINKKKIYQICLNLKKNEKNN